mmetsp:Transcript_7640/g.10986  ORF Transcript_7640/g.10986 Transcript_7640/m.10986 type:complete len:395 (+) Transcript_7640:32-1216(+)
MFSLESSLLVISVSNGTHKSLSAAGIAMGELLTSGIIGHACVHQGYLDKSIVSALSKTCFSILLPMFLCTSIMNTVKTYGLNRSSIAVPVIGIIHCVGLFLISKFILLPMFNIDGDSVEGRATTVCCTFGNAGVVPMIFAEALFRNSHSDILLKAYSQVSLYLVSWSPFFWSFGRRLLLGNSNLGADDRENKNGRNSRIMNVLNTTKGLFPPPVIGVLLGLFLASTPLSSLFLSNSEFGAPLQILFSCCKNFGRACNPLALLVLTSSLALGNNSEQSPSLSANDIALEEIPFFRRWSCVSLARFLISPTLMFSLLHLFHQIGVIEPMKDDQMLWFILMLQASMPSAQNSVLMLQVDGKTSEATRLAKFLFSMYTTAMIPVVVIATIMLHECNLL